MINVTATLTEKIMMKVLKYMCITDNYFKIVRSPLSKNVCLTVINNNDATFRCKVVAEKIKNDGIKCPRIVIFCKTLEMCGAIYRDITLALPSSIKNKGHIQVISEV